MLWNDYFLRIYAISILSDCFKFKFDAPAMSHKSTNVYVHIMNNYDFENIQDARSIDLSVSFFKPICNFVYK